MKHTQSSFLGLGGWSLFPPLRRGFLGRFGLGLWLGLGFRICNQGDPPRYNVAASNVGTVTPIGPRPETSKHVPVLVSVQVHGYDASLSL